MWRLFQEGGIPMWFIILTGMLALVSSAFYAFRGDRRTLGWTLWLAASTACSSIAGTAADLGTVFHTLGEHHDQPEIDAILLVGLGESMSPLILGFALLAATAIFLAVGHRRSAG